jgi:hypothetical protein
VPGVAQLVARVDRHDPSGQWQGSVGGRDEAARSQRQAEGHSDEGPAHKGDANDLAGGYPENAACPRAVRPVRPHTAAMVERRGDTFYFDDVDDVEVHRSIQDVWRAQNAAWRARVLGQLRQAGPVDELPAPTA